MYVYVFMRGGGVLEFRLGSSWCSGAPWLPLDPSCPSRFSFCLPRFKVRNAEEFVGGTHRPSSPVCLFSALCLDYLGSLALIG